MNFFTLYNVVVAQQHGFVPKKACNTNLLETVDLVAWLISQKKPVCIIFVDFSKAFDKVSDAKLLRKLEKLGIRGVVLEWRQAFLSDRMQHVTLGHRVSDWVKVTSGVPQGCVLAPTLFAAFVNDLPSYLSGKNICKLYADDLKIIAEVETLEEVRQLQLDLNAVADWCKEWSMELNLEKCKVMNIGQNETVGKVRTFTLLRANGSQVILQQTKEERDLGIILTPDFKFSTQAAYAASKTISA